MTKKWYVGAMNDACFIVDTEPRPSTDYLPSDRAGGAEFIAGPIDEKLARRVVDEHNAVHIQLAEMAEVVDKIVGLRDWAERWSRDEPCGGPHTTLMQAIDLYLKAAGRA
jgi:hypothetical protein